MRLVARAASRGRFTLRRAMAPGLLCLLLVGLSGCGITANEPLHGNYNKSETTKLQRRSDIRECEQRHYRNAGGPGTRRAALTQLRVEQCLEVRGYRRQPSGR